MDKNEQRGNSDKRQPADSNTEFSEITDMSNVVGVFKMEKMNRCAYLINFFPSVEDYRKFNDFLEVAKNKPIVQDAKMPV